MRGAVSHIAERSEFGFRVEGMRGKSWVDDWTTTHVVAVLGPFDVIF